jgi:hypothetical protein
MNESVDTVRQRLLADEAVREVITRRAYQIYEQAGSEPGHDIEHWLKAENEVVAYLMAGHAQCNDYFVEPSQTEPGQGALKVDDAKQIGRSKARRTAGAQAKPQVVRRRP